VAKTATQQPEVEPGSVDELVRILVLDLRYRTPQNVLIHDMSSLGLEPKRIAELLATTPGVVSTTKGRARPDWPAEAKAGLLAAE
jgi:hypothetical protein